MLRCVSPPPPRATLPQKEALQRLLRQPGCHPVVPLIGEARQLRKSLEAVRDLLQHPQQGGGGPDAGGGLVGAGRRVRSPLLQTNTDTGEAARLLAGLPLPAAGRTQASQPGRHVAVTSGTGGAWQSCAVWFAPRLLPSPALPHPCMPAGRLAMHEPSLQCTPRTHELRRLRRQACGDMDDQYE